MSDVPTCGKDDQAMGTTYSAAKVRAIKRQRERRLAFQSQGLCPHCGQPCAPYLYCEEARAKNKRRYAAKRRAQGFPEPRPSLYHVLPRNKMHVLRDRRGKRVVNDSLKQAIRNAAGADAEVAKVVREAWQKPEDSPYAAARVRKYATRAAWTPDMDAKLCQMLDAETPIEAICAAFELPEKLIIKRANALGRREFDPRDFSTPYAFERMKKW